MAVDLQKLFERIDARLASNQTLTSGKLAKELHLTIQDIERAVRNVENVDFREYRRYKRLIAALKKLKAKNDGMACSSPAECRMHPRSKIAHATVRYHLYGRGIAKSRYSRRCPLKDLSTTGMAFLTDRFIKSDRTVSLLLSFAGREDALRLEGRVVYASPVNVANYRYCIGIQFAPFDAKQGHNLPEALKALVQFEKTGAMPGTCTLCRTKSVRIH